MVFLSKSTAKDYSSDINTYLALNQQLHRKQRLLAQTPPGRQREALIQTIADIKREVKELNKNLNRIIA